MLKEGEAVWRGECTWGERWSGTDILEVRTKKKKNAAALCKLIQLLCHNSHDDHQYTPKDKSTGQPSVVNTIINTPLWLSSYQTNVMQ